MPKTALEKALKNLERHHPRKIDLGLERIEYVLKKLGNPHHSLPPTIHIAGTNGKGSTVAFVRAMAEAQGLKVHVYTSPHLVDIRERIVVGSHLISEDAFVDVLTRTSKAAGDHPLTHFEALTAAAFLAFHETRADLLILETGLGGRYDATNVITHPAAVGITPIDYDHAEFLGRDLAKITREKAGIFKRGCPAFSAQQSNLVRSLLGSEADKLRVTLKSAGEDFQCYAQQGRLIYEDDNELLDLPLPVLAGNHQIGNAGLAISLARSVKISTDAIEKGLLIAQWPARFQALHSGSLGMMAAKAGAELWLDGGHNPHAARALADVIAEREAHTARPLVLIMGMLANKDAPGFLDAFEGLAHSLIAVPIQDHASLSAENLIDIAKGRGIAGYAADTVLDALHKALKLFKDDKDIDTAPRILICGSLYLAGEVLALNELG
ncbi:MAG TPA: bifunctional folylpolyglutamate synthase/dihydrofolate synthase [Hellea balneolensis]|uniref:Dihydrofolate synthase/folylpolyglutamate synthase n=1 Tax=Hellea balneolensis TaxID=287478 RepID=A0A7C3GLJ0_9PROT|nr:bifunctional folylpolyglutamate synthase/dihydrofolate synthase [Hellea balneolensis]